MHHHFTLHASSFYSSDLCFVYKFCDFVQWLNQAFEWNTKTQNTADMFKIGINKTFAKPVFVQSETIALTVEEIAAFNNDTYKKLSK